MSVEKISDEKKFGTFLKGAALCVVHFSDEREEECTKVTQVLNELAKLPEIRSTGTQFCVCDTVKLGAVVSKYKIETLPTVIIFKDEIQVDRIVGADEKQISDNIKAYSQEYDAPDSTTPQLKTQSKPVPLETKIKALVNYHDVMVFIEGNRKFPKCSLCKSVVDILDGTEVQYNTFDISTNKDVSRGLKEYSGWPTFPQVYAKGKLVGGFDVIKKLHAAGELNAKLKAMNN